MGMFDSLSISGTGMTAQRLRMDVGAASVGRNVDHASARALRTRIDPEDSCHDVSLRA